MLFHSLNYIAIFIPILLILFFYLKSINIFYIFILSSLVFYSKWNFLFVPLLIFTVILNYFLGKLIIKNNSKFSLFFSIFINLIILAIFKYLDFFIQNINFIFNSSFTEPNLPFPLGISFYTFQIITLLLDCYYKNVEKLNIKEVAVFIIFFPQLIAGPIIKYNFIIEQIKNENIRKINIKNLFIGLIIFFIGFSKKVFFADNISLIVENGYNFYNSLNFFDSWLTSIGFTLQLYFDFSGYVDMAIGTALLFNLNLPNNFNSPYKSNSMIIFWQKWHITLSNFFQTYLFYPIIKNFNIQSYFFIMSAILFVFLINGLWHGPSWLFVIFGFINGIGVVFNHLYKKYINYKIPFFISVIMTFLYFNISLIFFRSPEMSVAIGLLKTMFGLNGFNLYLNLEYGFELIIYFIAIIVVFSCKNSEEIKNYLFKRINLNEK